MTIARLRLAHLPTPLEHLERLSEELECELWIKRDDATGGPEAGNKIRKLEYLLADAQARGADTLITCGGKQSNHARATAVLGARLGMAVRLYLRDVALDDDGGEGVVARALEPTGNLLLDLLTGADVRFITRATYARRDELMAEAAAALRAEGKVPYVIPEGGSNGLGALGYVNAMREVKEQHDEPFDVVVHACGSGGTAAGVALGASHHGVAAEVCAMAVCDDALTFEQRIAGIVAEARELDSDLASVKISLRVDDRAKGPAYAVTTLHHRKVIRNVARKSGIVLDPVYTGKAMAGLWGVRSTLRGKRVLFIHTGGLPGLLAQASEFADVL